MLEKSKTNSSPLTVLDIFCGAGGMSLGFQEAGCKILGGIDNNPYAVRTYNKNFPKCKFKFAEYDISLLQLQNLPIKTNEVDILIGGPPCQVFSRVGLGKMKSLGKQIESDPRNFLYQDFVRCLKYYKPLVFLMENVDFLAKRQNTLLKIIKSLELGLPEQQEDYPGYKIEYQVLTASDYGVPQIRKRLFIVGVRRDLALAFKFPKSVRKKPVSVGEAISDLIPLTPPYLPLKGNSSGGSKQIDVQRPYLSAPQSDYQIKMRKKISKREEPDDVMNHICRSHNPVDMICFAMIPPGGKYLDLPEFMRRYRWDIFDDKYKRLAWEKPSWTLTAHMRKDCLAYIHPKQNRSISVREAARIQSFPDDFVFDAPMTRMFELVGNSVPPLLVKAIARAIVEQVKSYKANH
jgi:DNA (cytosine-5)-methyltransferase 1